MQQLQSSGSALPDDVVAKLVAARVAQVLHSPAFISCLQDRTHASRCTGRCAAQRLGARWPADLPLPSCRTRLRWRHTRRHHPPQHFRCRPPSPSLQPRLNLLLDDLAEERCAGRVVDVQGRRWHTAALPPPAAAVVAPLARDAPESVRARLRTYAPLAGVSCEVDGGQAPLEVLRDVIKAAS